MPNGSMPIRRGSRRSPTCCARSCWRRRRTSSRAIRSRRSRSWSRAGRIANRLRHLGLDLQRELLDLFTKSAGDYLDHWFESAPIKAAYGFDGIVGNYASPYTPGSAYVLLHHCFGEVNGKKGVWGHAIGGMGAITQAMAKAAAAHGVEIRVDAGGARGHRREGPRGRRA